MFPALFRVWNVLGVVQRLIHCGDGEAEEFILLFYIHWLGVFI